MIALVFPFQTELEAFLTGLVPALPKGLKQMGLQEEKAGGLRIFTLESRPEWRLIVCGQGKVEAALACQMAAQVLSPSAYLLVGSACGLDERMKAGEIVLADPSIEWDFQHGPPPEGAKAAASPDHHPVFRPPRPFPGLGGAGLSGVKAGGVLSADRNVFDPDEKRELMESYGALAAAWEGAGFHRFLRRNQATGWELRLITEEACEGRPTLESLRERMVEGFPALYPLIENLDRNLEKK